MAEENVPEMGDVADVTHSTAFLSIDSLLESGFEESKAVELKKKFRDLHDRVLQIYNHDNFLLKRARQARKDLETQKAEVEKRGREARDDDEKIQTQKKELQQLETELAAAQEKESMLQVEALELERKKQNLTHDLEDAIAAEEARLRPQIESLHKEIKEIGDSIEDTTKKFETLREERERLLQKEAATKEEIEKIAQRTYEAKLQFTRIEREPERAKKQADIVIKANMSAQKELKTMQDLIASQANQLSQLEERKRQLTEEKATLTASITSNRSRLGSLTSNLEEAAGHLKEENELYSELTQQVSSCENRIKETGLEYNNERDRLNKTLREKENSMKMFKKIDQAKADLNSECEVFRKQMEILLREKSHLTAQRARCNKDLEELKRDVDILINDFLKEEIKEKRKTKEKESIITELKELEEDIAERAKEMQKKRRDLTTKSIKREQVSRECSRNQGRVLLAKNELKVKEVVVRELQKRRQELAARLEALKELFQNVKHERSAKAAQIQASSQRMSETQEKIKILDNELEVLRRERVIKEELVKKQQRDMHKLRQKCKNLLVQSNKDKQKLEVAQDTELNLSNQMKKLNGIITNTEDEMLELKKNYEDAVENRNYTGIQLIDRNDELCILYEKANIQETILKRGMIMLNQRQDEIQSLTAKLSDVQRQIELCQRVLPQVRDMEEDLASLLLELQDERWRAETLEVDLTDPYNGSRWRKLGGSQPEPAAQTTDTAATSPGQSPSAAGAQEGPSEERTKLEKKKQELEERVAAINERLMEKDLVEEEVNELSNKLRQQALNGRDFTLALAKRVNHYQSGIKNKTKKMMATLSELSMVQASSIKLQMDVQQLEEAVTQAQERTEQGLPPTESIADRYEKEKIDRQRRAEMMRSRKERLQAEEEQKLRSNAEQRPNAYIPDGDLGLPKPYGGHAPFKPTLAVQSNVIRFCRKPELKELDFDD